VAKPPNKPEFPDAPELPERSDSADSADSADLADDYDLEPEPKRPRRGGAADTALPWVLSAVVVLLLAVSAGLISAWVVASLKAVPIPPGAIVTASPDPGATDQPSGTPSAQSSEQPRHTPTPSPAVTPEAPPFVHVVERGESLSYIADLYGVTVADILALNDIPNPDKIRQGRELLIPGYGIRPSPSP
jgi:LysM repeat protein